MIKFLDREKQITNRYGILHFSRWTLFECPWGGIHLHTFYRPDEDEHLHDHPWDFWSLIIKGGYKEQTPNGERKVRRFSLVKRKAEDAHKVIDLDGITRSIVFTGPRRRQWGYNVDGKFLTNKEYRRWKHSPKKS